MAGMRNYETGLYNQFEELMKRSEEQTKLLKENNKTIL